MSEIVCSPLGGKVGEKLDNFFQRNDCFIEVNPGHVIMPKKYQDISDEIINCDVRPDDIWMISYPRSGKSTPKSDRDILFANWAQDSSEWYKYEKIIIPFSVFSSLETFLMADFLYYVLYLVSLHSY